MWQVYILCKDALEGLWWTWESECWRCQNHGAFTKESCRHRGYLGQRVLQVAELQDQDFPNSLDLLVIQWESQTLYTELRIYCSFSLVFVLNLLQSLSAMPTFCHFGMIILVLCQYVLEIDNLCFWFYKDSQLWTCCDSQKRLGFEVLGLWRTVETFEVELIVFCIMI